MLRKTNIKDIKRIHSIINAAASKGEMLPRSLGELYDNMRDYFVYVENGMIVGTGALHICWEDLAEIRSLCVVESSRKTGIGRKIVNACIDEAKAFQMKMVFLLTYQEGFFKKCGFSVVDKRELPQKIWSDCIKCPKFPECDEIAMAMKIDV
ncbi:MAG TPA: N-acetyltransferase [Syntrophorhabdaceae bacterium]|jgi:amino-acid N-acetyltransferase|nr:N-acetyltransferase [Syntrophorhabdaceae bacterium]MDI9561333.1 N-acetyltransferase [Pseudomonadota bacterium]OQC50796.1 MAG: Amino-acid acetyltransferase [Deltaproteobacteria bacterium ADurb.Bin026]MBV6505903.1 Amino-acid acetyltransferase [Syntrophorhabdaceae bacterium]HNQ63169.1 N-acetyltransferase [Syntrophorhabdaceae bacterium]